MGERRDPPARGTRTRLTLVGIAGIVVGGAGLALVGRALVGDRQAVGSALGGAGGSWVLGAVALGAAGMLAIALPWASGLRLLGAAVAGRRHVAWYFVGEIGKYVPGGIWPVLGRGEMARRRGVPAAAAYGSVALSLVALYLAAGAAVVVLLPFRVGGGATAWWAASAVLVPVGLLALHPRSVSAGLRLVARVARRDLDVTVPSWAESLRYVAAYLPAWALIGLATWAVARALTPDAPVAGIAFAAVLSWLAGFLAVPVPGGLGVREAVFVAASGLSPGIGAAVALLARALFMALDAAGAVAGAAWLARGEGGRSPTTTLGTDAGDPAHAPGRPRGR